MKPLLALFVFGALAFGGTIPVSVTGTGSFFLDNFGDNYATACFSGSDGTNSVSVCDYAIPIGGPPTFLLGADSPPYNVGAFVDGLSGVYWKFQLGGGLDGNITLQDASGNAIVSQAIQGYIQITGDSEQNGPRFFPNGQPNDEWQESGTLLIVPTPEPSSGILLALGICCVVLIERGKRKADASTHF